MAAHSKSMAEAWQEIAKEQSEPMTMRVSSFVYSQIFKINNPVCVKLYDPAIRSGFIVNGHRKQDWVV